MIVTLDIADLGVRGAVRALRHRPNPSELRGLRWADVAIAAPLATKRPPALRRAVLIAFWDDEASARDFAENGRLARPFRDGFHAVLQPLRAFGAWPGLPADIAKTRAVDHQGPVLVTTLGRLRLSQTIRFLRASRPAERAAVAAPGLLWGTAAARPPFLATISAWEDSQATVEYAYPREQPHHAAIDKQRRKDFHHQSAFVRYVPIEVTGSLDGPNPLPASAVSRLRRSVGQPTTPSQKG